MPSWLQRIVTVTVGAALIAVGTVLAQPVLITVGVGVVAWSVPHVADLGSPKRK